MASYSLVLNSGSTSRKFALAEGDQICAEGFVEKVGDSFVMHFQARGRKRTLELVPQDAENSLEYFCTVSLQSGVLKHLTDIELVIIRVVAPGTYFAQHRVIDPVFVERLKDASFDIPTHIPVTLRDITDARRVCSQAQIVAASDSAYHQTIPSVAREYAFNPTQAQKYDLYRFGYHGLSVSGAIASLGEDASRVVVVHAGGGASVTAVHKGKSIYTSMGYTPLTGAPMPGRAFDLDMGALFHLIKANQVNIEELMLDLYTKEGLVGYAGGEGTGLRELLDQAAKGESGAMRSLNKFGYHMRQSIFSAVAALGGVDAVVLTGTALVRSAVLRQLTLEGLSLLGVSYNHQKNKALGNDGGIIDPEATIPVHVLHSREMEAMVKAGKSVNFA